VIANGSRAGQCNGLIGVGRAHVVGPAQNHDAFGAAQGMGMAGQQGLVCGRQNRAVGGELKHDDLWFAWCFN